jgi:hypothetical protein
MPAILKAELQRALNSRERLRIFYGDRETGKAWPEEFDVLGYIGTTTGNQSPILVNNARSMGGGLLTDSIVAVFTTKGACRYKHPFFDVGNWEILDNSSDERGFEVTFNGEVHAWRFKTEEKAARYVAFMTGKRFSK